MARILITEDDPAIKNILRRLLNAEGHTVEVAPSGDQAWEIIERDQPDLLLLDLTLPGIDGREVYRRARASGYDFPIIVVTATASPSEALADMPHTPILAKPFDLDQLLLTVDWALRKGAPHNGKPEGQTRVSRGDKTRKEVRAS
jgi:DNA-binding response OmpR family regulator